MPAVPCSRPEAGVDSGLAWTTPLSSAPATNFLLEASKRSRAQRFQAQGRIYLPPRVCTAQYYSALKRKELLARATARMALWTPH